MGDEFGDGHDSRTVLSSTTYDQYDQYSAPPMYTVAGPPRAEPDVISDLGTVMTGRQFAGHLGL
jgi:hypothetical protein